MITPLFMAQRLNIDNIPDSNAWKYILKKYYNDRNILSWIWNTENLLNKDYKGEYSDITEILVNKRKSLYYVIGVNEIPKDYIQDISLAKESLSMFFVVNRWALDKEIYTFDEELEFSLADSEKVELPVRILDRLPYHCMYFDFAEKGYFKNNFDGAFICAEPYKNGYNLIFQRVKDNGQSMFGSVNLLPEHDSEDAVFVFGKENIVSDSDSDRNKDWTEFGFFILNALLYLCAENSEIKENEYTQKTYRKPTTIKNKFSEIKKWECGFRYGETVRQHKKEQIKAVETTGDTPNKEDPDNIRLARTVSAYTRKAHWHHYWVGKGRSELILKWIAPTPCGYGDKTAVVHKVE